MKKLFRAFGYAVSGLKYCWLSGQNIRIETAFALGVVIASFCFSLTGLQWLVVILNIGFVISAEIFNTAIEKLCDEVSKEINPAIKFVKDVSAAAVLFAAIISAISGLVIFVPIIIKMFYK